MKQSSDISETLKTKNLENIEQALIEYENNLIGLSAYINQTVNAVLSAQQNWVMKVGRGAFRISFWISAFHRAVSGIPKPPRQHGWETHAKTPLCSTALPKYEAPQPLHIYVRVPE